MYTTDGCDVHPLTAAVVREGLEFITNSIDHFLKHDSDVERALRFQRQLKICTPGYQELYKKLAKTLVQSQIAELMC